MEDFVPPEFVGEYPQDYSQILPSYIPELECLNLNGNRIAAVPPAPDGFGALRHLMLRGNAIGEWASTLKKDVSDGLKPYPVELETIIRI